MTSVLHFLSNVICAFIPNKPLRDKVRVMIRYPRTLGFVRFVRRYARNMKQCQIKTTVGYGCKNFIVILNNKYVFKFPLRNDGAAVAAREMRIVNAFYKISPIKIPKMKTIRYKNLVVRQYEFATGKLLTDIAPWDVSAHREHIAKQLANFLYVIGAQDPDEIRDLKPDPHAKPGFMYGWFQDDIWQNFMLDEKTYDITYFIDWENAKFESFQTSLYVASHNWDKFGYRGIIVDVMAEYAKIYFKNHKK